MCQRNQFNRQFTRHRLNHIGIHKALLLKILLVDNFIDYDVTKVVKSDPSPKKQAGHSHPAMIQGFLGGPESLQRPFAGPIRRFRGAQPT